VFFQHDVTLKKSKEKTPKIVLKLGVSCTLLCAYLAKPWFSRFTAKREVENLILI